jgi:hypothetical protein
MRLSLFFPRSILLAAIVVCFVASHQVWANSVSFIVDPGTVGGQFGGTPLSGPFIFTPGLGNTLTLSNVPVGFIVSTGGNSPFTVTGSCGGSGCLTLQTGPEIGAGGSTAPFVFGSGGSITLTGTIGSFTGVIFHGTLTTGGARPDGELAFCGGNTCSILFVSVFGKLNPAVAKLIGVPSSGYSGIWTFSGGAVSNQRGTYQGSESAVFSTDAAFVAPEPGAIYLLGTGLLGVLGLKAPRLLRSIFTS